MLHERKLASKDTRLGLNTLGIGTLTAVTAADKGQQGWLIPSEHVWPHVVRGNDSWPWVPWTEYFTSSMFPCAANVPPK